MSSVAWPKTDHLESIDPRHFQVLAEGGHEISALLRITTSGNLNIVGSSKELVLTNEGGLPAVIVRLGTKVSDPHPSSVGFRVLLLNDRRKPNATGSFEDYYHVVSCKFGSHGENAVVCSPATEGEMHEVSDAIRDRPKTPGSIGGPGVCSLNVPEGYNWYRLDFYNADEGFTVTRHGLDLSTTNSYIRKIEKMLPFLSYTTHISLFFLADDILLSHLEKAIKRDCIGLEAPSWKVSLPEDAIPMWPGNIQTRTVAGSTGPLNVLNCALREDAVRDGQGTSLESRPQAKRFREYVHATYPGVRREPRHAVYPVMLNVSQGLCIELPFGASMFNRENTYAGINALHKVLGTGIPGADVGIVTFYPSQLEAYQDALRQCHKHALAVGYDRVKTGLLENWVGKEVGVAIVDMVRNANASGNLGYLSQARRLKLALSLHRNGLIIIGDRKCTVTSKGHITSTKLEKVLQWFDDNGRILDVSNDGLPLPASKSPPVLQVTLRAQSTNASMRKFVGIPELDQLSHGENICRPRALSKPATLRETTSDSFARQGFSALSSSASQKSIARSTLETVDGGAFKTNYTTTNSAKDTQPPNVILKNASMPTAAKPEAQYQSADATLHGRDDQVDPRIQSWMERFNLNTATPAQMNLQPPDGKAHGEVGPSLVHKTIFHDNQTKNTTLHSRLENVKPEKMMTGPSPATLNFKLDEVAITSPSQKPMVKLPVDPEKPTFRLPNAANTELEPPIPALNARLEAISNILSDRSTDANAQVTRTSSSPHVPTTLCTVGNGLGVCGPNTDQVASRPDFKSRYRAKYQAIRSIFDVLHNTNNNSAGEDHLFRRLGEAYINKDARGFDFTYSELLGMANGLHMKSAGFEH